MFKTSNAFLHISLILALILAAWPLLADPPGGPTHLVDLALFSPDTDAMSRIYGTGTEIGFPLGALGIPVGGGADTNGDGFPDYAISHMISSPQGRVFAGEVHLVFGDGTLGRTIDTAIPQSGVLQIIGAGALGAAEMTGTEIWMADVTGDGIGELLIGRQNFSLDTPSGPRFGAGALTILVGGPELSAYAAALQSVDLANPPAGLTLLHLVGAHTSSRLGIWVRTGDVDGDGIADIAVGSDQESDAQSEHRGAVYVVRGGAHLAQSTTIDLAAFGSTALAGQIARIAAPAGSDEHHLGATVEIADLDGNGRGEVLAAAALGRSSAGVQPVDGAVSHVFGGVVGGRVYLVWDDAFPAAPWPAGHQIDLASTPGTTAIDGGMDNMRLGEALLGGLDYDGDDRAEVFLGDLGGDGSPDSDQPASGIGYVLYKAERLRGASFNIDNPPPGQKITKILGQRLPFALGADTVAQGDFDGDGYGDLMYGTPMATADGRSNAGTMHIFFGRPGRWPKLIETTAGMLPPQRSVRITEIWGANGTQGDDFGDVLCYAATAADIDGDGKTDVLSNEMAGNGPAILNVGNLIILSGELVSPPFHQGLP